MKLLLNNTEEILNTDKSILSINEIRQIKKFSFTRLVVKVNDKLIKRENFDDQIVKENDKVDIIHLISGG